MTSKWLNHVFSAWQLERPRASLIVLFITWKFVLLSVACTSPYPGYDTSTRLLLPNETSDTKGQHIFGSLFTALVGKLTRWDAIYFAQISHRGALFEQEWAFGWGFANLLNVLDRSLFGPHGEVGSTAIVGILVSNISHLLAVLVLYEMSILIAIPSPSTTSSRVAFVSASLHIISPAGLFLSAPYAESSFSFTNFAGFYIYAYSLRAHNHDRVGLRDASLVLSGLIFGVATTFRSNGLLSGSIFCFDLFECALDLFTFGELAKNLRRSIFLVIAGCFTGIGYLFPQYLAYREFCTATDFQQLPLWCSRWFPSIYTWVQRHYWNVGLFRYWTISNAPLFLLAAPMLLIMILSAVWIGSRVDQVPLMKHQGANASRASIQDGWISPVGLASARRLAMPQLVLAILALTSYHVQIVTRISSGYPLWYWWLASKIDDQRSLRLVKWDISVEWVVKWMVLYSLIQAGLFAAFLPPA
ncbi:MAG: hypothetical protein Q9196_002503 [Gyalolechia fulgens]